MTDLMGQARQVALAAIEADFAKVARRCDQIYQRQPKPGHRKGAVPLPALDAVTPELRTLGVVAITDTRHVTDRDLGGAGIVEEGTLVAFHVTDDPGKVMAALQSGADLQESAPGYSPELGQGLYASGVPEYWAGRAASKYDFLRGMSLEDKSRLAEQLHQELTRLRGKYITEGEYNYGLSGLRMFVENGVDMAAITLAGQPFNIQFWRPEWLAERGFAPGKPPEIVEVRAKGRFAEMERQPKAEEIQRLRRLDFDGAYLRNSLTHDPQIVFWDRRAIRQFGDWGA